MQLVNRQVVRDHINIIQGDNKRIFCFQKSVFSKQYTLQSGETS